MFKTWQFLPKIGIEQMPRKLALKKLRSGIARKRKDTTAVINAMSHIENFPMTVGKKVILRAIPYWRVVGTEKWIQDEESRYICPKCGNKVFRGAVKCNQCKAQLDLD